MLVLCIRKIVRRDHRKDFVSLIYLYSVPQRIYDVETGQVDAVIVKDLSRLGRHKIQTALFIDYLRQKNVAVISVTENLNTLAE